MEQMLKNLKTMICSPVHNKLPDEALSRVKYIA